MVGILGDAHHAACRSMSRSRGDSRTRSMRGAGSHALVWAQAREEQWGGWGRDVAPYAVRRITGGESTNGRALSPTAESAGGANKKWL